MKKGKSSKFGLIVGISAVTAVALAGTGIAGWVITTGASNQGNANITVYTAERKGLKISDIKWYKDDATKSENKLVEPPSFIFGKSSSTHDKAWLTATDVKEEQLSLVMKFTVTKDVTEGSASDAAPVVSYTFGLSNSKDQGSKYKDAKDKGYITDTDNPLDTENFEYTKETLTGTTTDNKVYTYTETLKFNWGTTFGGNNPYDYYNGQPGTDDLGKTANTALENLYNDLKDLSFTVTINANYAA